MVLDRRLGFYTPGTAGWESAQAVEEGSGDGALRGRRQARPDAGLCRAQPNAKAAEVLTKYLISNMFAKAIQGRRPRKPSSACEAQLKKIYGG